MMADHRNEHLNELVQRITSITTRLVPDYEGIELRFINQETNSSMSRPSLDTINNIMRSLPFRGWTETSTNLKRKVLDEVVYTPLRNGAFKRPVLIFIITDGHPEGPAERDHTLKGVILECGEILREYKYDPKGKFSLLFFLLLTFHPVVRFQISQIGSDEQAENFLTSLDSDPTLRNVLYCTAGKSAHFAKEVCRLQCSNEY